MFISNSQYAFHDTFVEINNSIFKINKILHQESISTPLCDRRMSIGSLV